MFSTDPDSYLKVYKCQNQKFLANDCFSNVQSVFQESDQVRYGESTLEENDAEEQETKVRSALITFVIFARSKICLTIPPVLFMYYFRCNTPGAKSEGLQNATL